MVKPRAILTYPDERLKQCADEVLQFDQMLLDDIADLETAMLAGPGATGIAAPQIGISKRIVLIDATLGRKVPGVCHGRLVLVNPEITAHQGLVSGREGCLSVPDYTGNVSRAKKITVSAQDTHGQTQCYEFEGFEARLMQHEIDHLDGLLFLDRIISRHTDLFRRKKY